MHKLFTAILLEVVAARYNTFRGRYLFIATLLEVVICLLQHF